MKNVILQIAIVIIFICILFEQLARAKKDGLDKLAIIGLSMSIIGIVVVIFSSFFD